MSTGLAPLEARPKPRVNYEAASAGEVGPSTALPSFRVLGVRVHAVQISDAVRVMERWVGERSRCHSVVLTGMHGMMVAQHDDAYRRGLNEADLVLADGWPVKALGELLGYPMRRRVYGPELMRAFAETTASRGLRHFFYGGEPGVAEELARELQSRCPGVRVAGTHAPPMAPLPKREDPAILEKINSAGADILWVGLGTPKQEQWMSWRRPYLRVPVIAGVGAAFNFHTGRLRQAPGWMQEHGLEWLFRLAMEPRRLWRRYLLQGSEFSVRVLTQLATGGIRRGV